MTSPINDDLLSAKSQSQLRSLQCFNAPDIYLPSPNDQIRVEKVQGRDKSTCVDSLCMVGRYREQLELKEEVMMGLLAFWRRRSIGGAEIMTGTRMFTTWHEGNLEFFSAPHHEGMWSWCNSLTTTLQHHTILLTNSTRFFCL